MDHGSKALKQKTKHGRGELRIVWTRNESRLHNCSRSVALAPTTDPLSPCPDGGTPFVGHGQFFFFSVFNPPLTLVPPRCGLVCSGMISRRIPVFRREPAGVDAIRPHTRRQARRGQWKPRGGSDGALLCSRVLRTSARFARTPRGLGPNLYGQATTECPRDS